jgi:hypothetical protein
VKCLSGQRFIYLTEGDKQLRSIKKSVSNQVSVGLDGGVNPPITILHKFFVINSHFVLFFGRSTVINELTTVLCNT